MHSLAALGHTAPRVEIALCTIFAYERFASYGSCVLNRLIYYFEDAPLDFLHDWMLAHPDDCRTTSDEALQAFAAAFTAFVVSSTVGEPSARSRDP
jgi:hypothetical protein